MCGINGIIARNKVATIEKRIVKMNNALFHRGPDASGYRILDDRIALGHRRLSILDLNQRSNQPMQLVDGKYIIVYNGEIFNYRDLRQQLAIYYTFQTNCDTEVLLAGIEYKGVAWTLQHANGMFAFVAYNTQSNEVYIARDRFGIKPLFYCISQEQLILSSEIKGILASGLVPARFNESAIDEYLGYRYVREPYTFFQDIYQLRSSTYLHIDADLNKTEHVYWQLPSLNFDTDYDEERIIADTKVQVEEAMKRWFIADVRVGAYLSGGVDSSLTSAILSQYVSHPIDTYTIGFEDKAFNEFEYAQIVADKYGTRHHTLLCQQGDYIRDWKRLIAFKDAPLGVPNEIPLAQMSSELKKDMTVVISGEGADELFGGYGRIFRAAFDYENHTPDQPFYQFFTKKYEYVERSIRDKYLVAGKELRTFFDKQIGRDFEDHRNEENIFRFFHNYHIQGLLQRVDMTTMQTSVEARPPFLDHQLVEYVYTHVPYDLKLHWNDSSAKTTAGSLNANEYSEKLDCPKYVLKRVSESYLPKEIIYRKKVGFPVPLSKWFPDLKQQAKLLLADAEWLNREELEGLFDDLQANERAGQLLWMFMNVQLFYNQYFRKNWLW